MLTASMPLAGCDPGMIIRQAQPAETAEVVVRVAKQRPFIGENWYAPSVTVTNNSGSPITVTGVELVTANTTYQNKPLRGDSHPLQVAGGETVSLETYFHLEDDVWETFKNHAQMHLHYRAHKEERTVDAIMEGVPLSAEPDEPSPCTTLSKC